jgi:hypothetical protein
MAHYVLKATGNTTHLRGFSPNLKPALVVNSSNHVVNSGNTIDVETYACSNGYEQAPKDFVNSKFLEICHHLPTEQKIDVGTCLVTDPIFIIAAFANISVREAHCLCRAAHLRVMQTVNSASAWRLWATAQVNFC